MTHGPLTISSHLSREDANLLLENIWYLYRAMSVKNGFLSGFLISDLGTCIMSAAGLEPTDAVIASSDIQTSANEADLEDVKRRYLEYMVLPKGLDEAFLNSPTR